MLFADKDEWQRQMFKYLFLGKAMSVDDFHFIPKSILKIKRNIK